MGVKLKVRGGGRREEERVRSSSTGLISAITRVSTRGLAARVSTSTRGLAARVSTRGLAARVSTRGLAARARALPGQPRGLESEGATLVGRPGEHTRALFLHHGHRLTCHLDRAAAEWGCTT